MGTRYRHCDEATCGVCKTLQPLWKVVDGFIFVDCQSCGCIAIDDRGLETVESGNLPVVYDSDYWEAELQAAHDRSWGVSVVRSMEAILYCRRPVENFIDIGSGPGYLLDAISAYLPSSSHRFFGVEMFPPSKRTANPNYRVGSLSDLQQKFDAGLCMEVVEHLTASQLAGLAQQLSSASNPGAFYIFNTGLADFVRLEDPSYIDPVGRGHIVAWSLYALRNLFEPYGFTVWELKGKSWAFGLEFMSSDETRPEDRIWAPPPENKAILHDAKMGSVPFCMAVDAARAY